MEVIKPLLYKSKKQNYNIDITKEDTVIYGNVLEMDLDSCVTMITVKNPVKNN